MKQTKHWADIQEKSFLLGIRLLFDIYRFFGKGVAGLILYPVVFYYWLTNKSARLASYSYLHRLSRYSPASKINDSMGFSLKHFFSFADSIVDKLAGWCGFLPETSFEYQGKDLLMSELNTGKGVLLFGSHFGNLELCRVIANHQSDIKINVLVHTKHAQKFNQLLNQYNSKSSLNLFQVTDIDMSTVMILADKIDNGELVIIAADRVPINNNRRTIEVGFLGTLAAFPQGPYILGALLACPIYTVFCVKDKNNYKINFELFSRKLTWSKSEREHEIEKYVQLYAKRLETEVLKAPLQWFNFYEFWIG
jgi:predicted LPLAT superfamily acyltransferase